MRRRLIALTHGAVPVARPFARLWCCLLVVVGALAVPGATVADAAIPADPVRVLIVGDSATQGSSGDWTWRYRLWERLTDAGEAVDFVGPREDLWDLRSNAPGAMSYADPGFDRDHAARWGMWSGFPDEQIAALVTAHRPDVIIIMLGINDILYGRAPSDVADDTENFVAQARAVDGNLSFVVAEATQHWYPGAEEFNAALPPIAEALTTTSSPVVVATTSVGYDEAQDTWDHSHPNARGEVKIAAAVADSLHTLGVGDRAERPLVLPPVGPRTGPQLSVSTADGSTTLSWVGAPGATSHLLWERDVTDEVEGEWTVVAAGLGPDGQLALPPIDGDPRREFRLQPVKGDDLPEGEVFSNVVVTGGPRPQPPVQEPSVQEPPKLAAPQRVRAVAGLHCVRLAWRPVTGASAYLVERKARGGWVRAERLHRARARLHRLPDQRRWRFRIRAVHGAQRGEPVTIAVGHRTGHCR